MSDDPVKECEVCGEPVKRLLFPVAIQFKGNGFYTTDYARRSSLGSAGANSANTGGSDSPSESAGSTSATKVADSGSSEPAPVATTAKSD